MKMAAILCHGPQLSPHFRLGSDRRKVINCKKIHGGSEKYELFADGTLIVTKLAPPKLPRNNIVREAILAMLSDNSTLSAYVIGAAGFGKSTVLRQMYDAMPDAFVRKGWLSLDARDNTPSSFVTYLCETLSRVSVLNPAAVLQDLSASQTSGLERAFDQINQAAAGIDSEVAIFLDDFQVIKAAPILKEFAKFLDAKSEKLRVFLAARNMPALQLHRRELNGTFFRIDHNVLKFSPYEAEKFFEASLGRNPGSSDMAQLMKSTEGWPAGLQIASISYSAAAHQPVAIPSQFGGSSERVAHYLTDNVFAALPQPVKDFLLATAPLKRFCAGLCRHLLDRDDCDAIIDWLLAKDLFIVSLDNTGTWYRYHNLFSDFLIAAAQKSGQRPGKALYRRASQWCLANGLIDEAVDYLLETRDFDEAAKMISHVSPDIARRHGDTLTMIRWIESLPESHRMHYPTMMLDYAFSLCFALATNRAQAILVDVRACLASWPQEAPSSSRADRAATAAYADTVDVLILAAREELEAALAHIAATRRNWPDIDFGTLGILSNVSAYCHMIGNRPKQALKETVEARIYGLRSGLNYVSIWADCIEAMIHFRAGDLEAAEEPLSRARRDVAREGESTLLKLLVHMLTAEAFYLKGDIALAQDAHAEAAGFSASFGPVEPLLISHRGRAWCAVIEGNVDRALEIVKQGQALGLRQGASRLTFALVGQEISILVLTGDVVSAQRVAERWGVRDASWSRRFQLVSETVEAIQWRMIAEFSIAELSIAERQFDHAIKTLNMLERRVAGQLSLPDAIRLKILKAHALENAGRSDPASREISQAAQIACQHKIMAPFLELAPYARPLLQSVMARRNAVETPGDLMSASAEGRLLALLSPCEAGHVSADAEVRPDVADHLTERELVLLRLIHDGMTNAQIAAHLVISVATVKWHLRNTFQKLGSRNRTAALAAARKRGLITT